LLIRSNYRLLQVKLFGKLKYFIIAPT
ncbi:hypothetical protein JTE90_015575, partial [Oedothorax gibbosus]